MSFIDYLKNMYLKKKGSLSLEDQYRLNLYVLLILITVPTFFIFIVLHIVEYEPKELIQDIIAIFFLSISFTIVMFTNKMTIVYFVNTLILQILVIYMIFFTPYGESKLLWLNIIPLLHLILLGKRYLFVFLTISFLAMVLVNVKMTVFGYTFGDFPLDIKIRFSITFIIMYVAIYFAESMKEEFQEKLLAERKKLKNANRKIRALAITDRLTGCYNRLYLDTNLIKDLDRLKKNKIPVSFILCDIDFFKSINDQYGHKAGDVVLKIVGKTLLSSVRKNTDWVIRYGGEEFLIVLNNTNLEQAQVSARLLNNKIAADEIFINDAVKLSITVSFGVSTAFPDKHDEFDIDDIIKVVDYYLYQAKRQGRNRVIAGDLIKSVF